MSAETTDPPPKIFVIESSVCISPLAPFPSRAPELRAPVHSRLPVSLEKVVSSPTHSRPVSTPEDRFSNSYVAYVMLTPGTTLAYSGMIPR